MTRPPLPMDGGCRCRGGDAGGAELSETYSRGPGGVRRVMNDRPTISAFARSPDGGRGLARDMRVRWALEEVAQPYDVRLVTFDEMKLPEHKALQPFGQIPTFEADDLALFETGAIILHIAETHHGLLPDASNARAQAISWMFAALNTVEPPIVEREMSLILEKDEDWFGTRLSVQEDAIRKRLADLARRLGDAEWLDGTFSAGDLLMVTVLLRLKGSDLLSEFPGLAAYLARGEARPAFVRAYEAQRAVFLASEED